jgi:hypothetical protein
VITRSKVRFLNRPTQEDIQAAIEADAMIVVRVPVPERWRAGRPVAEAHRRVLERCNAILRELDLTGGHPRVMLLADTCDSVPQFREKVWETFGA